MSLRSSVQLFFSLFVSYEVLLTLDKEKHRVDGPIYYYLFNSLLYCLLVMHIYWWVLIFRMLVKQIQARGKVSEDVRSGKLKICCVQNVNFSLTELTCEKICSSCLVYAFN